jgi:glycosyltransferase involved in cell wall biosynthesis
MFAPAFAPYAASENIVNSKLALAFLRQGHEVCVISRRHEIFRYGQEWSEPWLPLRERTQEVLYGTRSRTHRACDLARSLASMRHPLPGIRWARRALALALELHREKPFDVVLSRAPNDAGHLPALFLARTTGVPWIANWNDPPHHLWPHPYDEKLSGLRRWVSARFVRQVFENARYVSFPSERLRRHVVQRTAVTDRARTVVIPHLGHDRPSLRRTAPGDVFQICHAGNLSPERCPRPFLRGLSMFLERERVRGRVVFEVVGVYQPELEELARQYGLHDCLRVTGALPYAEALARLEQSDVLLVIEAPCEEGIFLPSKVADYACTGRPILAVSPARGTLQDLLSAYGGGICASNRSVEEVCRALTVLYRHWHEGSLSTSFRADHLGRVFSEERVLAQYGELFRHLCGATSP